MAIPFLIFVNRIGACHTWLVLKLTNYETNTPPGRPGGVMNV